MEFAYEPKSGHDIYTSEDDRAAIDSLAARYIEFLTSCKTERETVDYVVRAAETAGYARCDVGAPESETVFRVFHGKTVLLARKGKRPLCEGIRLLGAHGDTPRLDLKQHPLYESCDLAQAKTHYYGGVLKYQWMARPLALHGVVVKVSGEVVRVSIGEEEGEPVFCVPDLLPHLAKKRMEQNVREAFEAERMNIILGHAPVPKPDEDEQGKEGDEKKEAPKERIKARVLELLHAKYGITEEDLYSAELQAVPAGSAREVGLDGALVGGYGQDDRACVFCGLEALLAQGDETPEHTQVVIFWDKEEIGSDGITGAKSRFMEYALQDLIDGWDAGTRLSTVFLNSKAVSADVAAALDPDYQEVHDKLNAARLGFGPAFSKYTGHGGKYMANDASAEYIAFLRNILNRAGIPWQLSGTGKVDLGGGGTVAKELAIYGLEIIDCGPPVLSMHSPFELSSKADIHATALAFGAFLAS